MTESVTYLEHAALWWELLEDGRIECELCPRHCQLAAGQRGFCFVRQNVGGRMVLTTYGRSSGFCVDPIEKKPLFHFYPGSGVLSFGTAGCNLGCRFCQNWEISRARALDRLQDSASPESVAEAASRLGCRSVAFTYNDPVVFAEYAMDVADACHAAGVAAVAVTAGYMNAGPRRDFFRHMDAVNVDLKGFTEDFYHRQCCGQLAPVLDTLTYLKQETSVWLEVTTLLIPGENDSEEELGAAADWFAANLGPDVPWHFTAFHPDYKMLDKSCTPLATLIVARAIARSRGLHYVYTGNVQDPEGSATGCPHCGQRLITRKEYEVGEWHLVKNACSRCGGVISGVFAEGPDHWGTRRLPVSLGGV